MENVRGHLKTGLAKTHEIVCSSASGLTFAGAILVGFEAVTLHETMCFSQKTFEVRCPSLTARAFTLGLGMRLAGTVDPQTYWTSWEDLYGTDDTYPLDFAYACTPSLHLTPIVALTDWTRYCDIYWGGLRVGAPVVGDTVGDGDGEGVGAGLGRGVGEGVGWGDGWS